MMHLLSATPGTISNGDEAIDLEQSPGDIVILSAADSELACFSTAAAELGPHGPKIRLANLLQLKHPYSVDLYLEKILSKARFIGVILLGGKSYWPYGIDEIAQLARERNIKFAALANGQEEDPSLTKASTVSEAMLLQLRDYMLQGGVANAAGFLKTAATLAGIPCGEADAPLPIADAGLYLPGIARPTLNQLKDQWIPGQPVALVLFYRALMLAGTLSAIDEMIQSLKDQGLNVIPAYIRALRAPFAMDWLTATIHQISPDIIINTTAFAASSVASGDKRTPSVLEHADCPILQAVFAGMDEDAWQQSPRGLGPRDMAMNIALPEVDGRIFTRAIAFKAAERFDENTECSIVVPQIAPDRMAFVAKLASNWAKLRTLPADQRNIALVLANYPNRDGRIGNGVGLDTPASAAAIIQAMQEQGYKTGSAPIDSAELMQLMTSGTTNDLSSLKRSSNTVRLELNLYHKQFAQLPSPARTAILDRWGPATSDPFVDDGAFHLPVHHFDRLVVAVQPARGYNIDPKASYHDPDLVPPHAYLAFHIWLDTIFNVHAVVHVGKHGNLEWLPGKAVSLSANCFPEICAGPIPQIYPFIVNDPGEGTQAKRRIGACIIDHLTPPLTRAESYGPLKQLEALVDEYYLAAGMDPRRLERLKRDIIELAQREGLDKDAGALSDDDEALAAIDNYLCELKEMQIRDGLHIFTKTPDGRLRRDLIIALARTPRGYENPSEGSFLRALAHDLNLAFDPLDCQMGAPWTDPKPTILQGLLDDPWRTHGDTIERLEILAAHIVDGEMACPGALSSAVMEDITQKLAPAVDACGSAERNALLDAIAGKFVLPGPSGAPTRGRPDVLPTGRNFYSVDTRSVPTAVAWSLGQRSAELLVEDFLQREGDYPRHMAVSAWGTANMRTGGDDIAQALALMGVRPKWEWTSGRVIGFEIRPLAELRRPRVDVTFRVSGFFRDAFPEQIDLIDSAARAIMALEESETDNPAAARHRAEIAEMIAQGADPQSAYQRAGTRIFGSKPGAYGAGLQAMIDERLWEKREDLGRIYLDWGGYAYGGGMEGDAEHGLFAKRLAMTEAVIQNQDNREHDLLDSDDYYQFEGGIAAAVETLSGKAPLAYHNDMSRPERPVIRTLEDEIGRVVRARLVNPKWIAGVMRHGYKGAFEIAASVDYLFAFAATTGAVKDHHFDAVYAAFIEDDDVRAFMQNANPAALRETAHRLTEALERGLWKPRSNSAASLLAELSLSATNAT